jgi:alpha-mannosidase
MLMPCFSAAVAFLGDSPEKCSVGLITSIVEVVRGARAEAVRCVLRSWSTQLDLMERYPEHRFVASQAQQFKWLEQDYPQLFKKVKAKVVDGQFLPIGGMWVESDQLLPSGESLARQFLYGQRYFKSRFGQYCRVFWLPDSFGYNSASPQIARLAGLDFFFTQKSVSLDLS